MADLRQIKPLVGLTPSTISMKKKLKLGCHEIVTPVDHSTVVQLIAIGYGREYVGMVHG